MTYIIDPSYIYWISVLDSFKGFNTFVIILSILFTIIFTIAYLSFMDQQDVVPRVVPRVSETYETMLSLNNSIEHKYSQDDIDYYFKTFTKQVKDTEEWKTLAIISGCIFVFGILVNIFVPSKDVMIEMVIAKTLTVENVTSGVNFTADTIKDIIDYVVNAISSLK